MDFHENQKQHRIPRTYLKRWSFIKDGVPCVTVFDRLANQVRDISVSDFTVTVNEFDLPSDDPVERRHYETTASLVEGMFDMVIDTLDNQKRLTEKHEDILRHFVSLTHCRAEIVREEYAFLLEDPDVRTKFIREITLLKRDHEPEEILLALTGVPPDKKLQLVTGIMTNHFVSVLRSFSAVILESQGDAKWLTTDLPVVIDKQGNYDWLIGWDTEVYFPLSPKYCVFLFHPKSERNANPLRDAKPNRIHKTNDELVSEINHRLLADAFKHLVLPQEYKESFNDELLRLRRSTGIHQHDER